MAEGVDGSTGDEAEDTGFSHVTVLLRTLWTVTPPPDVGVDTMPVDSPAAPPELAGRLRTEPLQVGFPTTAAAVRSVCCAI